MKTHPLAGKIRALCLLTAFGATLPGSALALGPALNSPPAQARAAKPVENQIRQLIQDFYFASTHGDAAFMDKIFSNDPEVLLIGTDPSEVVVGHEAINAFWTGLFDALASIGYPNNGGLAIVSSGDTIQVDHKGPVAWASDFPTFALQNGDVPFRLSFVFVLEEGRYKISQIHFSIGSPNADLPA